LAPSFFEQKESAFEEVALVTFIERQDSWQPKLDVSGKDCFYPVNQEERSFSGGLGGVGMDRPQHGWEVLQSFLP
jgi:hypothetical protein